MKHIPSPKQKFSPFSLLISTISSLIPKELKQPPLFHKSSSLLPPETSDSDYKINWEEDGINDMENTIVSALMLVLARKLVTTLCYITSVFHFPLLRFAANLCPVLLRKCPYYLSKSLSCNNLVYWFELAQNVAELMVEIRPK